MKRVIVIGGGASGLMAAICAARSGAKVTVLEHGSQIGKKLLATGNGRCNFTNTDQNLKHYHSAGKPWIETAFLQFGQQETVRFFSGLGIYSKNRNGYLYPHSDSAASMVEVLRMECEHCKIKISCNADITGMEKAGDIFRIHTPGWDYEADRVILATGSCAAPATGSDGSGYQLAKAFGHTIIEPAPALVQLLSEERTLRSLAGIRIDAGATLLCEGKAAAEDRGELQFNANNISGIPVFQISEKAARLLLEHKRCTVRVDFMPDFEEEELKSFFKRRISNNGYKTPSAFLVGLFPKKLAEVLCEKSGLCRDIPAEQWNEIDITNLCQQIKKYELSITRTNGFENAQCCSGGVSTSEIDPFTMESKLVPGLYLAGELVDVNGDCGGYNLQWAWTSGYLAGVNGND